MTLTETNDWDTYLSKGGCFTAALTIASPRVHRYSRPVKFPWKYPGHPPHNTSHRCASEDPFQLPRVPRKTLLRPRRTRCDRSQYPGLPCRAPQSSLAAPTWSYTAERGRDHPVPLPSESVRRSPP